MVIFRVLGISMYVQNRNDGRRYQDTHFNLCEMVNGAYIGIVLGVSIVAIVKILIM